MSGQSIDNRQPGTLPAIQMATVIRSVVGAADRCLQA
jgi:hypothetical protein